ncbi:MAG: hypothetical protein NTZ05_16220 [Chloroflexi bacterium]|nr:hypothetical protein [Chloroflexota bacterium]
MPRIYLVKLAIILLLTALPFTAAAKQQPPDDDTRPASAALPAPAFGIPPDGTRLGSMGAVTLQWDLPAGATQYQLQVTPANGDGPGVNLIRNAESQFVIPAPPTWYILLPGMTYTWRVRVTDARGSVGEGDPSWSPWSPSWRFTTPPPTIDTISPTQPALGATATSQNPTLVWTDANPGIFYYEIQLSSDPLFNTDPFTATAAVYWNLVHGGETAPQNSWAVPTNARLDPNTRYYWRVRPRVQGNGTPVNWGLPFWFMTVCPPGSPQCAGGADLSVTTLDAGVASVAAGSQVQIQYTIKNLSVGTSVPAEVHAVLSPDINITRLKQDLGPINTVGALASQQSVNQLATVQIPANQPVGGYFLGVYVDWTNQNKEAESGKSSNNGLGKLLTVLVSDCPTGQVRHTDGSCVTPTPTTTPSPTATWTPSPTPTPSPTATSTATPTLIAQVQWTARASMPTARERFGLAAGNNGRLYAIGGAVGGGWTAVVEEYDPSTGTWRSVASLSDGRYGLAAVTAPDGKIYAIGGFNLNGPPAAVEVYDPATNVWTRKAGMPTPRGYLALAAGGNGRIYAIGGANGAGTSYALVEEFDPQTNTWAAKASMPTARHWLGATTATNGKIYAIGGARADGGALSAVEEYDIASNTWKILPNLPVGRWGLGVGSALNGRIYAIGGHDGTAIMPTVTEYDPISNLWATRTSMPTARLWLGVAAATNGKLYAIGGGKGVFTNENLGTVEEATVNTTNVALR